MSRRLAIGIDLGTTNSCVAVFRDGKVDILENDDGPKTTPSCVAFDDSDIHIGDAAKAQEAVNLKNTVFEVKRLIGRRFADATVQEDIRQWPFEVFDDNGAPKIKVQYKEERKDFSPEQISSMVLKKMKQFAKRSTNGKIKDAVITVPAYFNDSQRQATIDAGKIAGLNVLSIINEPTAAALAYRHSKKGLPNQTVLVFDLGGGTFDVAILTIAGLDIQVKAVGGDTHLGGADFDSRIMTHYVQMIKKKYNIDISMDQKKLLKLRRACTKAKIRLSSAAKVQVSVDSLIDNEDFVQQLLRPKFEKLCMDLFKKTTEHVESVLNDAGMNKSDINEVILVGGSSRIPKIQKLLIEFFDGKKLNATINPDEAVAYGAAVKAALDSGEHTIEEIMLADVVPLSLGLKNLAGDMVPFIERNSRIPITVVQRNWTTTQDNQTFILAQVFEGERKRADDNHLLGTFRFEVGEKEKAGVPKITYTFEVDVNGILHVSGVNEKTNCSGGLTIISNKGRLNKEDITRMVQETKQLKIT